MMHSRSIAFFVALALLETLCGKAAAQKDASPSSVNQRVLSLNLTNSGQHVVATVGQQVNITLQTIGPAQFGTPQISSPAIRFENVAVKKPRLPAGPTVVYIFETSAEGEAQIQIPSTNPSANFAVTIEVRPAAGKPHASMTPDQANGAPWNKGWTNLVNDVRQTFIPSLPTLTGVEVELVVANPGQPDDTVTLTLLDSTGALLADISKTVPVADCGHVLFVFPNGGLEVSPGQVYSIRLNGSTFFGWKYVAGGYEKGDASFNGKPLLPDARSTFLFRTFGANRK
jgi:hypothetical protein